MAWEASSFVSTSMSPPSAARRSMMGRWWFGKWSLAAKSGVWKIWLFSGFVILIWSRAKVTQLVWVSSELVHNHMNGWFPHGWDFGPRIVKWYFRGLGFWFGVNDQRPGCRNDSLTTKACTLWVRNWNFQTETLYSISIVGGTNHRTSWI